jgi:hypothetical protein
MNQRIRSRLAFWIGNSALEGVGMGRGGEKVLPMVELVRGSRGLSVASHSLCPLTLQASLAPPLTPRRPQLRQNC